MAGHQPARRLDPVQLGHRHVHDDDVQLQPLAQCQGITPVICLPHDDHVLVMVQQQPQALSHHLVVVYQ